MSLGRDLPNDKYLAAINANGPSAANPFVTNTDLAAIITPTNRVIVRTLADFPAPSGGTITLLPNTEYFITASINIAGNYLTLGDNTVLTGLSSLISKIIYTGTGAGIRGTDVNCSISRLGLIATNNLFSLTNNAKTKVFVIKDSIVTAGVAVGTVTGFYVSAVDYVNHQSCTTGWSFVGNEHLIITDLFFGGTVTGTSILCNSGSFESIIVSRCYFDTPIGATGLNINNAGITLTSSCSIIGNVFDGLGTKTTGFNNNSGPYTVQSNRNVADFVRGGSMYWEANTGTMSLNAAESWKKITGGTTNGIDLARFTHTSPNRLTYIGAQPINVTVFFAMSAYYTTGGAFIANIGVAKNGVFVTGSSNAVTIYSADEPSATFKATIPMVTGDYLETVIKKVTGGSTNIVISYLNISLED